VLAIVTWSTTVAFSRDLSEQLGTFTAAACIYLIAGAVSLLFIITRPRGIRKLLRLPVRYLAGCGGLFVLYMICFYLGIGFSANRQQVIEVGIANYLWPSLTLLFSLPLLGKRARIWLLPGMAMALAGVILAMFQGSAFSAEIFAENLRQHSLPYVLALLAAVSWALYSNLSRRWGGEAETGGVPLFLLATGIVLLGIRFVTAEETPEWSARTVWILLYVAIFPASLAYIFWDTAMRRGRVILVMSLSYFTPLLSTIISCRFLHVKMGWSLLFACVLVILGAAISRYSILPAE